MKRDEVVALLGRTDLFRGLDAETRLLLAEQMETRSFVKGQLLFQQGDAPEGLLVLAEGRVKVYVTSQDGDEMVFVTLRPPDVFGELAALDGETRSASAEALEPTTILMLSASSLQVLRRDYPQISESLLFGVVAILRRLSEQAADLVFLDLHGRLAKLLMKLADDRGTVAADGCIAMDLQLTQTDLANMIGASRQSVNATLRSLERRGYIEVEGRTISIKKPDQLRRRAGLQLS
ncbi:MAG: Crp/Fnr family transcriptional regulator [Actinomycetota bacterium]